MQTGVPSRQSLPLPSTDNRPRIGNCPTSAALISAIEQSPVGTGDGMVPPSGSTTP